MIDAGVTTAASRARRRCFALIKLGNGQRLIMKPCNFRTPVNNSRSQQDNQILLCSLSTVETLLPRRCVGLTEDGWMDSLSKGHPRSCGDDSQPTPDTRNNRIHREGHSAERANSRRARVPNERAMLGQQACGIRRTPLTQPPGSLIFFSFHVEDIEPHSASELLRRVVRTGE
jgi:hypothetical protein